MVFWDEMRKPAKNTATRRPFAAPLPPGGDSRQLEHLLASPLVCRSGRLPRGEALLGPDRAGRSLFAGLWLVCRPRFGTGFRINVRLIDDSMGFGPAGSGWRQNKTGFG